jgi:hypothetical protein
MPYELTIMTSRHGFAVKAAIAEMCDGLSFTHSRRLDDGPPTS